MSMSVQRGPTEQLLTSVEAMTFLGGVSRATFHNHIAKRLPALRVSPRRVVYRRSDLEAYLERVTEGPRTR